MKSELKVEELPTWDGSHKTAIQYFWDVREFADLGGWMPEAMGFWLWSRLKSGSDVRTWFSMLDSRTKAEAKSHYLNYLNVIKQHYLGRTFQDDANLEYSLQQFRQPGYERESPRGFITRRVMYTRMLASADDGGPLEVHFVMLRAPLAWSRILGIDSITSFKELYAQVVQHEQVLAGAGRDNDTVPITSDNLVSMLRKTGVLQGSQNISRLANPAPQRPYRQANLVSQNNNVEGDPNDHKDAPNPKDVTGEVEILQQTF